MRRRWVIGVLAAVVAGGAAIGVANYRGGGADSPRDPVRVRDLPGEPGALPAFDQAGDVHQYRIVYLVESSGAGDGKAAVVATTEVLSVERPFRSRSESWSGLPPGLSMLSTEVSSFGLQQAGGPNRSTVSVEVVPGPAANDIRVTSVLALAIERGAARVVGMREIDGERCVVVRTAQALRAGPITPGGGEAHTDSCVDRRGLLLEERQVVDGELRSRRVAVDVSTGSAAIETVQFSLGEPAPLGVREGGGSVQRLTPDSRPPGLFFEADTVPAGFAHHGRYAAVPPQPDFAAPGQEASRQAGVVDVWTQGAELIVLFQGSTAGGADPFTGESDVVDGVGGVSLDDVVLTGHGAELRIRTGRGAFVRLTATVGPDALVALARSLRQVESGTLTTVGD